MDENDVILNYFFTNHDKPIFAIKNMPQAVQSYVYMGVSRFPNVRERFLKLIREKCDVDQLISFIENGKDVNKLLSNFSAFAAQQNSKIYFDFRHESTAEGSTVFVVSENNPIYATEIQQDFFFPLTTMELSTRYSRKFTYERVYWDPNLMRTEFAEEAKKLLFDSFNLYERGFEILMNEFKERNENTELPEKVSVLDSIRALIPLAAYTTVILGGNSRAMMEHFKKLLSYKDAFIQYYAKEALKELSKISPEYFSRITVDENVVKREEKLRKKARELFGNKFIKSKNDVVLHYEPPLEETIICQILYPYCNLTFEALLDEVNSMNKSERAEILRIATEDRPNRSKPIRGFATRHLIFEIESPWFLWKDFKRHRMNIRFQQEMRGLSGYDIPYLIKESSIRSEYEKIMDRVCDLVERVYLKHGGTLSKTVALQACKKRFLLCMDPRQLTVMGELRTMGEGDRGYRILASKMIELAKEKNELLFGHIKNNYLKGQE